MLFYRTIMDFVLRMMDCMHTGCGPGVTGWVALTDERLGCFEYAANVIPAEICNGFEVAYCKQVRFHRDG